MTNNEMKAIYEANPEIWIVLWKFSNFEDDHHNQWTNMRDDYSNGRFIIDSRAEYKLIHIKHKHILDACLADNSVEIEYSEWRTFKKDFIESYSPELEYKLKEK